MNSPIGLSKGDESIPDERSPHEVQQSSRRKQTIFDNLNPLSVGKQTSKGQDAVRFDHGATGDRRVSRSPGRSPDKDACSGMRKKGFLCEDGMFRDQPAAKRHALESPKSGATVATKESESPAHGDKALVHARNVPQMSNFLLTGEHFGRPGEANSGVSEKTVVTYTAPDIQACRATLEKHNVQFIEDDEMVVGQAASAAPNLVSVGSKADDFDKTAASFDTFAARVFDRFGRIAPDTFSRQNIYSLYSLYPDKNHAPFDLGKASLIMDLKDFQKERAKGNVHSNVNGGGHGVLTSALIQEGKVAPGGFTHFLNPAKDVVLPEFRVYVNAEPEHITTVFKGLVNELVDTGTNVSEIKAVNLRASGSQRKDNIVMYVNSKKNAEVLAMTIASKMRGRLRADVPPMTQQLAAGVSIGQEPTQAQLLALNARLKKNGLTPLNAASFGSLRAAAIHLAFHELRGSSANLEAFKAKCHDIFSQCDIEIEGLA
ncbi:MULTISPECIES: T3SS effector HopA1 family protein [unclassified Caballeronia]|uniref:T3SS effector HopA1 family protein n=1 Tax=unclassified Caballeronia TaxID=2646786 RepID=UPI002028604F|nr:MULTISPECIES: T3SS effector HopA1 family protein [unclassified Caballeronia]